jgi:hypothetical protein
MDFNPGYFLVDTQSSMVRLLIPRNSAASFTVNSLHCCAAVLLCCCAAVLLSKILSHILPQCKEVFEDWKKNV